MEKSTFLSDLKKHMKEFDISEEKINEHIAVFEEILKDKSEEELQEAIDAAGGIQALLKTIYNTDDTEENNSANEAPVQSNETNDASLEETCEIQKTSELEHHIQEAEEITSELEKTTVNTVPVIKDKPEEYSYDLSDYDFDALFAPKYTKIELWLADLKEKMSEKTYKYTLPVAIIAFVLAFGLVGLLFALLFGSAVVLGIAYIATMIVGICFSLVPIGYGVFMSFKTVAVALCEIGIGISTIGFTMLICILIYNYIKRLVPYLFILLKRLFKYCIKLAKLYFINDTKEEV